MTRKKYYFDEDGEDRADLDPESGLGEPGGWWTCHPDTRAGDLVLLYRTRPRSDIAYVFEATTNAFLLGRSADYKVISRSRFEEIADSAAEKDPYLREELDHLNEWERELQPRASAAEITIASEAVRTGEQRHQWLGAALVEAEKVDGLTEDVQRRWDEWWDMDDLLPDINLFLDARVSFRNMVFEISGEPYARLRGPTESLEPVKPRTMP